jgi:hypothetical protein
VKEKIELREMYREVKYIGTNTLTQKKLHSTSGREHYRKRIN